ncbi:hypothetical protein EVAR_57994_1 [Eumeta japonica]|uniref:Uncharacterized protein n=1 Tax=Eumeta variegata TaxID=151549 RepID=A0A4C1Y8I8_EUMVA|nr:hypothetical protein EVAR_57994_1 [Eumeta japonica]
MRPGFRAVLQGFESLLRSGQLWNKSGLERKDNVPRREALSARRFRRARRPTTTIRRRRFCAPWCERFEKKREHAGRSRSLGRRIILAKCESIRALTVPYCCVIHVDRSSIHHIRIYHSKSWLWQEKYESRIDAVEMRYLRSVCGVALKNDIGIVKSESRAV